MGQGDSRIQFRAAVNKLVEGNIPVEQSESFFERILSQNISIEDVYGLISTSDVRKLVRVQPSNLTSLLDAMVKKLRELISKVEPKDLEGRSFQPKPELIVQTLNALHILARVLPFLFEDETVLKSFDTALWGRPEDSAAVEDEDIECDVASSSVALAPALLDSLVHLLHLPNFTIDKIATKKSQTSDAFIDAERIWCAGLGGARGHSENAQHDKHRIAVLRCLLVCVSRCVYQTPDDYLTVPNKWLTHLMRPEQMHAGTLLFSLATVVLDYNPVGWIPYSSFVVSNVREGVVHMSLQTLIALIDYEDPNHRLDEAESRADVTKSTNTFFKLLMGVSEESQIEFIRKGMSRLLNNRHESENTYLPNSIKQIDFHQELAILLWKLINWNQKFAEYSMEGSKMCELIVPLLYFVFEGRQDHNKVGLIHICIFIFRQMSAHREFGISLNQPFLTKLPCDLPVFSGTHGDLLIVIFHKLVINGPSQIGSLYNGILTTLVNASPYMKTMSMVSATKLLNLFELFSAPKMLYASKDNYQYVFLLLEIFNNIIQYQPEGNTRLIYAILRRKAFFDKLVRVPEVFPPTKDESGWTPSVEWAESWIRQLPLTIVTAVLQHLLPKIEKICTGSALHDEEQILEFLRKNTLVGLLPVPHPILIRQYQPNKFTNLWVTTFMWGVIYIRNLFPPVFDGKKVKLFAISFEDQDIEGDEDDFASDSSTEEIVTDEEIIDEEEDEPRTPPPSYEEAQKASQDKKKTEAAAQDQEKRNEPQRDVI